MVAIIHNRHPIERTFNSWISNHPETYHPLDLERFYIFVKTVIRYSRSQDTKTYSWLKDKIHGATHHLEEEDINTYCNKFVELQKFNKARCLPDIEMAAVWDKTNL